VTETGKEISKAKKYSEPGKKNALKTGGKQTRKKLSAGSPEHKADRWAKYKERKGKWDYERWSKQYDTNMENVRYGLQRESEYRRILGGKSETVKTRFGDRQIDIFRPEEKYMGQLKTGRMTLTKQAKLDIKKDAYLVRKGNTVEHILEKSASKEYLQALEKAGIKVSGAKIPK
jgi:hypothetical protein